MEKCTGGVGSPKPAPEESLRDERRQVEGRKRRSVRVWRIKPAGHQAKYHVSGVRCQVRRLIKIKTILNQACSLIMQGVMGVCLSFYK